jgi:hypothetical protein
MNGRDLSLTNDLFRSRPILGNQCDPAEWLPVYQWKAKRSPQSHKAVAAMLAYYNITKVTKPGKEHHALDGMETACWANGWRWTWAEGEDHSWFPPLADVEGLGQPARVNSPQVIDVLKSMDDPVSRATWDAYILELETAASEKRAMKQQKGKPAAATKKAAKKATKK